MIYWILNCEIQFSFRTFLILIEPAFEFQPCFLEEKNEQLSFALCKLLQFKVKWQTFFELFPKTPSNARMKIDQRNYYNIGFPNLTC
jgi:hypothetical protein